MTLFVGDLDLFSKVMNGHDGFRFMGYCPSTFIFFQGYRQMCINTICDRIINQ